MKVCNVCGSKDLPWMSTKQIGGKSVDLCNEHAAAWQDFISDNEEWAKANAEYHRLYEEQRKCFKTMQEQEEKLGKFWIDGVEENNSTSLI